MADKQNSPALRIVDVMHIRNEETYRHLPERPAAATSASVTGDVNPDRSGPSRHETSHIETESSRLAP